MDWTSLVTQLPALAAFIWFSLEQQKRFQASMDKRDEAYLSAINKIAEKLDMHDDRVEARIQAMAAATNEPKTAPRRSRQ